MNVTVLGCTLRFLTASRLPSPVTGFSSDVRKQRLKIELDS